MIEDIESFSKRNILNYAVAVNLERSVPDLYDGLKPVHRRILWGAYQQPKGQFVKSARIVGDVIGKYHPHGDCLEGDTLVYLLNGDIVPIKSLKGKGARWVLAYDEDTNTYVPAKARAWRVGQVTKKTYKIHLSDGNIIEATNNHPFFVEGKGWVRTEDLSRHDVLISGNLTLKKGYYHLNSNQLNLNTAIHSLLKPTRKGFVVHHKNHNRADNRPTNLQRMSRADHALEHVDQINLDALEEGRATQFKKGSKYRDLIRKKNSKLMSIHNQWLWLTKAMAIGRHAIEEYGELNSQTYANSRHIIYNGTTEARLRLRGVSLARLEQLIRDNWKPCYEESRGFTSKLRSRKKKARAVEAKQKQREVSIQVPNATLVDFGKLVRGKVTRYPTWKRNWSSYDRYRQRIILEYGELYGSPAVNYVPSYALQGYLSPKSATVKKMLGTSSYKKALRKVTPVTGVFVTRVEKVQHTSPKTMYDFTVDGYENMLIVAGSNEAGGYTTIVAHNSSVYQAMVGMVNSEAPLIEGKGNWGTLVDEAAAMRYTNARLSKYGLSFFGSDYITKEVTDFVPNYDDKDVEPVTLPAQLPNVLLNTASGIGWGTTTNLPAFTVKSVVNVLQKLLLKEKLNARRLARLLKPSLPYGGRLVDSKRNKEQWLQLMSQPSARIEYEAALKVDSKRKQIVIDEWPPGLMPDKFVERVRALPECDSVYNSKGTLEFTITCKRAYNETQFEAFVKKVQKLTLRAVSYRMNVTSRTANIVDGVVGYETEFLSLGVGPLLVRWLRARVELEKRSLRHRIAKQQTSIAYTELLIYAVSIKDVIFKSLEAKDSVAYLVKHGKLTEEQAKQILDLRVRQLSKLDDIEMRKRLKQQKQELKQLRGWLKRPRAKIAEDLKSFV